MFFFVNVGSTAQEIASSTNKRRKGRGEKILKNDYF